MGHNVHLSEPSEVMIDLAKRNSQGEIQTGKIAVMHSGILDDNLLLKNKYDFVLMHGSAEWMLEISKAVRKAAGCSKEGGFLSLLTFNRDRLFLKRGINGHLFKEYSSK